MKMKQFNLSATSTFVLLMLMVTFSGWAQNNRKIVLNPSAKQHQVSLLSEKSDGMEIQFQLNELDLIEVSTQDGKAFVVESPKAPNLLTAGVPDLFYLTRSVIIPDMGSVDIEVVPGAYQEIENIDIAPSKGNLSRSVNPNEVPFAKGTVYEKNAFYPQNLASVREPYIIRDLRGQSLDVFPVQYNPVTKTLRIYSDIKVVLKYSPKAGLNELVRTRKVSKTDPEFAHIYKNMFLNYSQSRYTPLEEEGELLIICHDPFMEAMQPFVNWKNTIGRKTTLVSKTTAGSTNTAIKTYITNYYNNPDNNLTYVLLVGDAAQIPSNSISTSGDSDNAYGYLVGTDGYNEIFVGRFSAETVAHVETQVQKMIHYERDINTTDTWLNIGTGVARNEGAGNGHFGEADYQHMDFIRDTLLNYTYVTVHKEYDGSVPGVTNTTATQISQRINAGTSIINYINHGSIDGWSVANYNITHVNQLSNVGKMPFIWSVACVNGDFVTNFCFAEAWLRATNNGNPTGAIGTMMSTINQDWQPPMTGQDEMVTILSESYQNNIKRTFGGLSINGSMKMMDVHGASGKKNHDTWTLFGDPTLMVRTDIPQEMIISHNPTLFLGSSSFTVSCDTDGAIVALSHENNGVVTCLGKAVASDGSATVVFDEPVTTPMDITVAITAYNKVTYINTVSAVPADEPYVVLHAFETTVSPDFGQNVGLNISLKNISEDPYTAESVTATLSTESTYATITDNALAAGTITPDQVVDQENAFAFSISNNVPDQTPITFTITISGSYNSQTYTWSQNFTIKANAPVLTIGGITIDDGNQGIPGVLDPGETANANIVISNTGHAMAPSCESAITTTSPYLTINGATFTIGDLEANASATATFSLTASTSTPLETAATITMNVEAGQYEEEKALNLIIGYIPEYNMSNDEVTACIGRFYDSGGPDGAYANDENFTKTFYPASGTSALMFNFSMFDIENGYEKLYIYNGTSTSAAQITGSPFSGTVSPGSVIATNAQGALTFRFTSDNMVTKPGWAADFYCVDLSIPPDCATNPSPAMNAVVQVSPVTLSWSFIPNATEYEVYMGIGSLPSLPSTTVNTNSWTTTVESNSNYVWKVVPKNQSGSATGCPVWSFMTQQLATTIVMHNGAITTCNSLFYDAGGATGSYANNEAMTLTVLPSTVGAKVRITFSEFNVETNYDYLKIYDGTSVSATMLADLHGTAIPESFVATNETGALTFRFTSDGYVTKPGWAAHLTCEGGEGSEALISAFTFEEDVVENVTISSVVNNEATIDVVVAIGTDITNLTPTMTISEGATVYPMPAGATDFSSPVSYNVISANGNVVNTYVVNVSHEIMLHTVTFLVKEYSNPIEGVLITVNNQSITTDASGEATIDLPAGSYYYTATKEGYANVDGYVVVTDTDVTIVIAIVDIEDPLLASEISIYPNPFENEVQICNISLVKRIVVLNSVGSQVLTFENNGNDHLSISTKELPSGFYLISFQNQNGETAVRKLIKQ